MEVVVLIKLHKVPQVGKSVSLVRHAVPIFTLLNVLRECHGKVYTINYPKPKKNKMARVSVSNEFFRQKARRQLMHEEEDPRELELQKLKAKVEQMEATIHQSEKRNDLLTQEMEALREEFSAKPEDSVMSKKLEEAENAFLQKCEEMASTINQLRKDANLPLSEKLSNFVNTPQPPKQTESLGIPWGAPNTRPWSSELESTALSIKESLLRKRLAPELGTKITIYDDQKDKADGKDHDYLFEMLDDKLTSPLAKNSSPTRANNNISNIENVPDLGAPFVRTRSKSPPKEMKKEPVRKTRRRTRRAPLSNITSRGNADDETDDDDAVFDFVELDDLVHQPARRSKRKRAV